MVFKLCFCNSSLCQLLFVQLHPLQPLLSSCLLPSTSSCSGFERSAGAPPPSIVDSDEYSTPLPSFVFNGYIGNQWVTQRLYLEDDDEDSNSNNDICASDCGTMQAPPTSMPEGSPACSPGKSSSLHLQSMESLQQFQSYAEHEGEVGGRVFIPGSTRVLVAEVDPSAKSHSSGQALRATENPLD